jgi:hypothetical protein
MVNQWKARDIATHVVQEHGRDAPAIVEAKWKAYGSAGDVDAVGLWVQVGIEVGALLDTHSSLASILEGATTKTMMAADGVTRRDIDNLMKDAKSKQPH